MNQRSAKRPVLQDGITIINCRFKINKKDAHMLKLAYGAPQIISCTVVPVPVSSTKTTRRRSPRTPATTGR
jgi:hypothetical protein